MTEHPNLPAQVNPHPANIILEAVKAGASPDQLVQLYALQRQYEADEARKAYNAAMAAFKSEPLRIVKDKHVEFGTTKYNHATLGNVVDMVSAALSRNGLAATWHTGTEDKAVRVTCRITHAQGHSEETTLTSAPDTSGAKNSIQAIGSAVSYLQRYTLLSLCGLATYDDDGRGAEVEYITEAQASTIYDMCNALGGTTLPRLLKWLKVEEVAQIEAKHFERVVAELKKQGAK